jgi:hypothetical protein
VAGGGPSGAQQLCESTEKVRAAGIWERRARRGGGAHRKGRTAALWHDFVEESVAPVPEGGGERRRRWREGVCSGVDERARRGGGVGKRHQQCSTLFIGGSRAVTAKGNGRGGEGRHVAA